MYPPMNTNTKIPKLISRPFLLLRLVVFTVLLLLNILTLSFAAFSITASRTWDKHVSAGPSLAVFNSSVFLFLSMLLLGERKYSHAIPPVSMVLAEVCWVTFMTMMTFLSGVLSTRLDPAKMCSLITVNSATCAASILVLPVAWMNFLIFFVYSVTLLIVTILHQPFVPEIWYSTISEIPWFDFSASDLEHQTVYGDAFRSAPGVKCDGDDRQQTPKRPPRAPWLALPRASCMSVASLTPAWAKRYNAGLTRGLHNPFGQSLNQDFANRHPAPSHPARTITKPTIHERCDDPFAARVKNGTAITKVPDHYYHKKLPLEPLTGFDSLLRWSSATTSSECYSQGRNTPKRAVDTLMVQNPPDRSSFGTVTTTTVVFSPPDRRSVNSLFPHDVGEEAWNLPLKKPPFRNGRGIGWTTAGPTQGTSGQEGPRK